MTAAWLDMPPRTVRTPAAACMPRMSSGLVSRRTRIAASSWACGGLGGLGGEDDAAGGRTGAGGEAGGEDVAGGGRVDLRVQVLDEAARLDAQQRLGAGDGAGVGEVDGDAHRGAGAAADRQGVEDGDRAVLDGELELAGVAEPGGGADGRGVAARRAPRGRRPRAAAASGAPRRGALPGVCGRKSPASSGAPVRLLTSWMRPEPLRPGPVPSARRWTTRPRPAASGAPLAWRRMRAEAAFQARAMARAAASSWSAGCCGHGRPVSSSKSASIASIWARMRRRARRRAAGGAASSGSKDSGSRPWTAWAKPGMKRR